MKYLRILCVAVVVLSFSVSVRVPQVRADTQFPDYRILVNTNGGVLNPGIPDFYEAIAGKSVGLSAWRSGAVGGNDGIGTSRWSFDDGTVSDATSALVWHTFVQPGNYNVFVDVYKSMGEFAWHFEQTITVYNLMELPALDLTSVNGVPVDYIYDVPAMTGGRSVRVVDFSGPCNGETSVLNWTGNISPYDAPRVSINDRPYVTSKGLPVSGAYRFWSCSVGPTASDPISIQNPSQNVKVTVTSPATGTANLQIPKIFIVWESAAPAASNDVLPLPIRPPKHEIHLVR